MNKSEIIRELLDKYPKASKSTIARICKDQYPLVFDGDHESIRWLVRKVTGTAGKSSRKDYADPKYVKYFKEGTHKGFECIEGDIHETPFFEIPTSIGALNIWNDLHAHYHDHRAINKAFSLKRGKALLINGDGLDMYRVSRFVKDPRKITKKSLNEELEVCKTLFKQLAGEFDHIYYKKGNHELRWESYLKINAPLLYEIEEFDIEYVYGLKEMGYQIIQGNQGIKFGDLDIVHGHETSGRFGGGKYIAKALIKKWQAYKERMNVKVLCGHHHFTDMYYLHNDDSSWAEGHTVGCLCQLSPDYNPFGRDNHGFAIAEEIDGKVVIDNIKFKVK